MPPTTQSNADELLTLPELAVALRRHGIIHRSRRTVYRWATEGAITSSGRRVRLSTTRLNGRTVSSVAAFRQFLGGLNEAAGVPDGE